MVNLLYALAVTLHRIGTSPSALDVADFGQHHLDDTTTDETTTDGERGPPSEGAIDPVRGGGSP